MVLEENGRAREGEVAMPAGGAEPCEAARMGDIHSPFTVVSKELQLPRKQSPWSSIKT